MIPSLPMKRLLSLVALMFVAPSAFAGLTYRTESSTTGLRNATIVGTVTIDGSRMRMDVAKGDNMMFKDNSIVLSTDGGKTMSVFDPSTKSYYDIQLDQVLGNATSMLGSLGDMVKVNFDNPQVSTRDAGDGGTIEGFPTRKHVLNASYDMNMSVMGQKMTSHLTMNTESWTTDQLTSEMSSFLQMRSISRATLTPKWLSRASMQSFTKKVCIAASAATTRCSVRTPSSIQAPVGPASGHPSRRKTLARSRMPRWEWNGRR